jgi:copper oxidase (laccase) domain-containing protein
MSEVKVWFGVAFGAAHFELGYDVRDAFIAVQKEAENAFIASNHHGKWLADIYQLARLSLEVIGVKHITGGEYCSYQNKEYFYSYRREAKTGRMASLIWLC